MPVNLRRGLRLGLGLALAALFLGLVLRRVDVDALRQAMAGARFDNVVAALVAFGFGYACRIERWRQMLLRDNPELRWRDCAGPLLGSFAANNVLPFRAGDVLRAFAFNARLRVNAGTMLASLFAERLLDLLMVLIALASALAAFGLSIHRFFGVGLGLLVLAAMLILALLLVPQGFAPLAMFLVRFVGRAVPRVGQRIVAEIERAVDVLKHLASARRMMRLIAWSLAAWVAEGGVFWFAATTMSSMTRPAAAWLALPVGTLATLIPSTPGYVGTFDYFVMQAMTLLGNAPAAAAAFALLVHALLWLPPTVLGGLYWLVRGSAHSLSSE
jgi:uncharacterized protein (TIRG00374 family)